MLWFDDDLPPGCDQVLSSLWNCQQGPSLDWRVAWRTFGSADAGVLHFHVGDSPLGRFGEAGQRDLRADCQAKDRIKECNVGHSETTLVARLTGRASSNCLQLPDILAFFDISGETTVGGKIFVRRGDQLLEAEVHDELVALNIDKGTCYGFNVTATRVWALLEQPTTFDEIKDVLLDEFDVDPETCHDQLTALLSDLEEKGLVEAQEGFVAN